MITTEWVLFLLLGGVAVASALAMLFSRNPVHAALWLVLTFFCVAGLFLILGAQFLFAVQIIVYTGAIMVLFLFVVMLLNLEREAEPITAGTPRVLGFGLAGLLLAIFIAAIVRRAGFQYVPAGQPAVTTKGLGWALYNEWVLPVELASILLLVAMVGAIVLARRKA